MQLSIFECDITPPLGHPLCAGWYPPAKGVTELLSAKGITLIPENQLPIVLCALDWAELSNADHATWRHELARQAGTTTDRVSVHCVHNHDSPWPDREAQRILDTYGYSRVIMDEEWVANCLANVGAALGASLREPATTTHFQIGRARVQDIASNRRVMGEDGKVRGIRWTRCRDASLRDAPEGTIDPDLKTISFWQEDRKLASLHYYPVHPTSYDGTGLVTHDFVGIARERLTAEEGVPHIYFTECAGNITAGKFNDGVADNRELFTQRIFSAMKRSEEQAVKHPIGTLQWVTTELALPWQTAQSVEELEALLANPQGDRREQSRAALSLAFRQRMVEGAKMVVGALHFGHEAVIVHLPAEAFIEYQLFAQSLRPGVWMAVPAYGDCGPGYIPLAASYQEGGYEPTDAFCSEGAEALLRRAITETASEV